MCIYIYIIHHCEKIIGNYYVFPKSWTNTTENIMETNSHIKSGQGNTKEGPWKYHARLDVLDLEKRM